MFFAEGIATGRRGATGSSAPAAVISARLQTPSAPAAEAAPADPAPSSETRVPPPPVERALSAASQSAHSGKIEPDSGGSKGFANAPDGTYYAANEIDVYPALSSALDFAPARAAAATGPRARALMLVLIDAQGIVDEVHIVEGEPGGDFGLDAQRALLAARFTPALKNGRAVKSRVLIRVDQAGADPGQ